MTRTALHRLARRFAIGVIVAAGAVAGVAAAPAAALAPAPVAVRGDVDDFSFASYEGDFALGRDESGRALLTTTEAFVARFPQSDQNKGIVRAIPQSADGVDLHTEVVSVTNAAGEDVPYTVESDGGFLEVATGTDDYVHGDQSYVITYRQVDVVRAFADTDAEEFYWDGPGTGWEQPFESAVMRVHVPAELESALTGSAACYAGSQGSDSQCRIDARETDGETVFTTSSERLDAEQTVTVAVGFRNGTFTEPVRPITWPVFTIVPVVLLVVSLALLVVAIVARRLSVRDEKGRGTVIAEYSPSGAGLRMEADIVDRAGRYVPAAMIRLAVSRAARIIDRPEHKSFTLELVDPSRIPDEDKKLCARLFDGSRHVDLWRNDAELGSYLQGAPGRLRRAAEKAGLRVVRRVPRRGLLLGAAGAAAAGSILFVIIASQFYAVTDVAGLAVIVAVGSFIADVIITAKRSARTKRGAELREYVEGLKLYLTVAEEDRIRMLQSPTGAERIDAGDAGAVLVLYEKLLPYAVLWGVADSWARVLEQRYRVAGTGSDWFVTQAGVPLGSLVRGVSAFTITSGTATPWAQAASTSSSGGSTGGGFAGGGGGGGGGGGR
ncbi:Predicted membrane protein [Paramicrobacterium humi]|uniref:Predicted membrane protein n=1 Tax=Paramicrobacterium humi TaxID=640635 RepID=A0A1H4PLE2_9MICO|nr:DUF2207 domain-containing protein [Microbacterium humi]SEC08236.1 Predicted membrane protein [Microbacterium humi]